MKLTFPLFIVTGFVLFVLYSSCKKKIDKIYGEIFIIDGNGVYPFSNQEVQIIQTKTHYDFHQTSDDKIIETAYSDQNGTFDFGHVEVKFGKRFNSSVAVQFPNDGWYITGLCTSPYGDYFSPYSTNNNVELQIKEPPDQDQKFTFRFHKSGILRLVLNKPNITSQLDTTWISISHYDSKWSINRCVSGNMFDTYPPIWQFETLADSNVPVEIIRLVNGIKTYQYDTISIPWSDTLNYTYDF